MNARPTKFIFVTGGVLSGLGKGLSAAAIGALLESRGLGARHGCGWGAERLLFGHGRRAGRGAVERADPARGARVAALRPGAADELLQHLIRLCAYHASPTGDERRDGSDAVLLRLHPVGIDGFLQASLYQHISRLVRRQSHGLR